MGGNNTPVFFIRDPLKFGDFIHTQKRDPQTNLKSPTMMWGLLVAVAGITALGNDAVLRSRHPQRLSPYGRFQQPHIQPDQQQERAVLREVALQEQAGDQELYARVSGRD